MKLFKKTVLPMLFVALAALVACNDDKDGDDYVFVPLTPAEKAAQRSSPGNNKNRYKIFKADISAFFGNFKKLVKKKRQNNACQSFFALAGAGEHKRTGS